MLNIIKCHLSKCNNSINAGCINLEVLQLSHLTTAKPLTKLVTAGGFFSTDVCPCPVACPPVCSIFVFLLSSIFFLNTSMKLPSLANAFPADTGVMLVVAAGLPDGEAGLPQLESLLLPLAWGLPCTRFESMIGFGPKQNPTAQKELSFHWSVALIVPKLTLNCKHRIDAHPNTI